MGIFRDTFRDHGWRIFFAVPCLVIGAYLLYTWGVAGLIFALPFLVGGGIIIGPFFTTILAEPFRSLFYPNEQFDRAQPMYSIPQAKKARGSYEEAIAEYEKIARYHPHQLKPYVEMIDIAVVNLRDAERAKRIYQDGLLNLSDEDDRNALKQTYEATVTRIHGLPEWYKEQEQRVLVTPDLNDRGPVEEPDGRIRRRFHTGAEDIPESDFTEKRKIIPYAKKKQTKPVD